MKDMLQSPSINNQAGTEPWSLGGGTCRDIPKFLTGFFFGRSIILDAF